MKSQGWMIYLIEKTSCVSPVCCRERWNKRDWRIVELSYEWDGQVIWRAPFFFLKSVIKIFWACSWTTEVEINGSKILSTDAWT